MQNSLNHVIKDISLGMLISSLLKNTGYSGSLIKKCPLPPIPIPAFLDTGEFYTMHLIFISLFTSEFIRAINYKSSIQKYTSRLTP